MIKKWKELSVDWKKNMLIFMHLIGKNLGDWCAEDWEKHGIRAEDAKVIIDEYEKMFPED